GTEDEVHVLLVSVVERVERIVAAGFRGMRRVENPQILQTPSRGDMRQKMVQKLAFTLAVEDDHWHLARAKAARQILRNDVFKECGLAGARSTDYHSMLDSHGIRPE